MQSIIERLLKAVAQFIKETWTGETLSETPEPTSASNETSVIQFAILDDHPVLLTGDVGPAGLKEAADFIESNGYVLPKLRFVQVPHHGSRRNVTPSVLNRWLGEPLANSTNLARGTAFCSAAEDDEDHPRKKVVNAFLRRGYPVHTTKGQNKFHYMGTPAREDWGASLPLPFSLEVEE
jgi:beta-lactamase superfamily II metal-dependent hydrolase